MVFDLSKPAVKAIKSSFGGGWVVPLNDDGRRVLTEYYGPENPISELPPLGNELGWIVEPQDAEDLAEYLRGEGIAWEVGI
jgi:hypothetical protein